MFTSRKTAKRLLVLSLGTILAISVSVHASAEQPPVPARKPAALRADSMALLRFPAHEIQHAEEQAPAEPTVTVELPPVTMAPVVTPQSVPQEAVLTGLPPVPSRKPAYQGPVVPSPAPVVETETAAAPITTPAQPGVKPEVKPEIVLAAIVPPPKPVTAPAPKLEVAAVAPAEPSKIIKAEKPDRKLLVKALIPQSFKTTTVTTPYQPLDGVSRIYQTSKKRTSAQRDSVVRLVGIIKQDVSNGSPTRALKRLSNDKAVPYLDPVEKDQLQTLIARGYLLAGKIVQSYELAHQSAVRSGDKIPQAGWVAGLAAWRMGNYDQAARMFSNSATSSFGSPWQASASAYWTSRAYMRAGKPQEVSPWLERAAAYPRTFYGLIATRSLGWDYNFDWNEPSFTSAHRKTLEAHPTAREGIALVKAGRNRDAEATLSKIDTSKNPELRDALIAFAADKNLSSFGMQLAMKHPTSKGGYYDAALYPLSPWKPRDGYTVDRALVHAIIRQESKFNPGAVSRSGAQGLMQVMPSTASYISGKAHFKNKDSHTKLRDPQTNMELGQRYIEKLLHQDHVGTELFSLVVAYNAGPGNLKRWKRELADMQNDPLLFIESIPMGETRAYVERVMSNYWIYRMRMNQPVPSLDAVAGGQWAQYTPPTDNVKQAGVPVPSLMRLATTN